jgi:hypothetical protein
VIWGGKEHKMGLDFMNVITKVNTKKKTIEVYPNFRIGRTEDLMTRGGDVYAVWDEESKRWLTDERDIIPLLDKQIYETYKDIVEKNPELDVIPL